MLAREGIIMNHKRLLRLYREENLRVRRRRGRKRAMSTRAPMALPQRPNQRWSLDFISDTLISGRRIRILAVVDDFTRECLALVIDTLLLGARVARELDAIIAARGVPPLMIVSDNGSCRLLDPERKAALRGCRPKKPSRTPPISHDNLSRKMIERSSATLITRRLSRYCVAWRVLVPDMALNGIMLVVSTLVCATTDVVFPASTHFLLLSQSGKTRLSSTLHHRQGK